MPGHGALASMRTWLDHPDSVLTKFWRDLFARARPQSPLLGAQGRWQHSVPRYHHARLQQLALGTVLAMFVLALLYFDSGSSRHRTSTSALVSKAYGAGKESRHAEKLESEDKALCRALSQMQVCSHRSSLGQSDKGNDAPFLERMTRLAASGIICYDIDVVATADGQLVVGYPSHVAAELRAAGRPVTTAQLDSVTWKEYVSAGLDKRHPLLQDVLEAFAKVTVVAPGRESQGAGPVVLRNGELVGGSGGGNDVGGSGGSMEAGADAVTANGGVIQSAAAAGTGFEGNKAVASGGSREAAAALEQERATEGAGSAVVTEQQQVQQQERTTDVMDAQGKGQQQPLHGLNQSEQQQQQGKGQQPTAESQAQQQEQQSGQTRTGQQVRTLKALLEHGGRKAVAQQQQQQQQPQQVEGQGQGTNSQQRPPPATALLLIELKDSAMRVSAAEFLHNATRALGIQSRVGLWINRVWPSTSSTSSSSSSSSEGTGSQAPAQTQVVWDHLQQQGSGILNVLGLPDARRLPDGSRVPLPLTLQPGDATAYDMFGPSVKHPDAALVELVRTVGARPVVTWVVDNIDEAMRVARAGGGLIVANDPLVMKNKLHVAAMMCTSGAADSGRTAVLESARDGDKAGKVGAGVAG